MTMFSLLSSLWFGQEVRSGRGSRRPCKPRLEILEDRTLLSYWTTVAPLPTARGFLAGAKGFDGRIYAIGGDAGGAALNTVQAYTTGVNTWAARANLLTARSRLAAAAGQDGRIYAIGGVNTAFATLSSVEAYNPANMWSLVAPMLTARFDLAAATGSDGRIYAMGGNDGAGNSLATVERLSTGPNTWTAVKPMNVARRDFSAATGADGRIYVFGGFTTAGAVLNSVECYNPATNIWTTVAPMPTARIYTAASLGPNSRLFVMGGFTANAFAAATNVVESYNPATNTWAPVTGTPTALTARGGLAAAFSDDGHIYAFGGFDAAATPLATVQFLTYIPGFGGGAAPANTPSLVSVDPISSTVITATPTVVPLQEVSNQGGVPGKGASDNTVPRDATDVVFTAGADTLSANLADDLFAGSVG
jgi:N-acetylneuraminic acid mutarotase